MKARAEKENSSALLEGMEEVATRLHVTVRYERLVRGPIHARHGSCRHKGRDLIIIDSRLGPHERLGALSKELSRFDMEDVFVPPAIRDRIERRRAEKDGAI